VDDDEITLTARYYAERKLELLGAGIIHTSRSGWLRAATRNAKDELGGRFRLLLMTDPPESVALEVLLEEFPPPPPAWEPCGECDNGWLWAGDEIIACACRKAVSA
jgi:hypothetical protein